MILPALLVLTLILILLYLYHVNRGMTAVPEEARRVSPQRWTVDEVKAAYDRNVDSPIDVAKQLPPKQNRRYVVVGATGLVGNWIATHLVTRGEDPTAIRILDLQQPRQELLDQGVGFMKVNVVDKVALSKAFAEPWPESAAHLPLSVFHTAAVIRPAERHKSLLPYCTTVNVRGTRNVLEAAREAGADCFIATSSGSVGLRRPSFWISPWQSTASRLVQVLSDNATDEPKEHDEFFGNYAVSKFQAELAVREADDAKSRFRTGCIRPSNGIYGIGGEASASLIRSYLKAGNVPTWTSSVIQNFVNAENVSIAHLLYEQRLVTPATSDKDKTSKVDIGGQSFVVTDPNPPIAFGDMYLLLSSLTKTPTSFPAYPSIIFFLLSYLIEWYVLLQDGYLSWILPPLTNKDLLQLQPALFAVCNPHTIVDDSRAREKPELGGLGFSAPITTMDGMCREVEAWNRHVDSA